MAVGQIINDPLRDIIERISFSQLKKNRQKDKKLFLIIIIIIIIFTQVRKMEFLMATALERKCDHIITTGGLHSNHCRTVAVVSRQLGFQPHLLLRNNQKVTYKCHTYAVYLY